MNSRTTSTAADVQQVTVAEQGVSVVICCYNSAARLKDTLIHLANQDVGECDWEILVVDNNSTDNTADFAMKTWAELNPPTRLRVVSETKPGQAEARRTGVLESAFEFILFCDDDNHLASDYIRLASEVLQANSEVAAIGGRGFPVYEESPPSWFGNCLRFLACNEQSNTDGIMKPASAMYTAGMLVRRSALMSLWTTDFRGLLSGRIGTKSLSGGEDSEMSILLTMSGHKLWYSSSLRFEHYIPAGRTNWKYIRRLRWAMGQANARLLPHKLLALNRQDGIRSIWILQVLSSAVRAVLHMARGTYDRNSRIESYFFCGRLFELLRRPRLIRDGIRVLQQAGFKSEVLTYDHVESA